MVVNGKNIVIYEEGEAILASRSCSVDTGCDTKEKSSPIVGDWREYLAGRKSWRVSVDKFVKGLRGHLLHVGEEVTLSVEMNGERLTGRAICVGASVHGAVGSVVTGSWNFLGNGGLE